MENAKTTPKDFFLYLGAMATLYVSAVSLLTLFFQYIETLFPDSLAYYVDPYSGAMRFAIASLIIIFPLYVFLTRMINEDVRANPAKRELGVRKWLIYLTLFVAGITLVVDLIVLINTFLGGDLTTRFVLKVVAVLVVIGGAFLYYLNDLKGRWEKNPAQSKQIGWLVSAVVLASIVGAFFIVGSPTDQRLYRFDAERESDLQSIQWQIVTYWQQKERLPETLADLDDPLTGFATPSDPETEASYGYEKKGPLSFELCATFVKPSRTGASVAKPYAEPIGVTSDVWTHEAGETCFERTIDPERFPPFSKTR